MDRAQMDGFVVAWGFAPAEFGVYGRSSSTAPAAIAVASVPTGRAEPDVWWDSGQVRDWRAAPAVWVSWAC